MIPAGWRHEGHPDTKTLHQFPVIQHGTQWKWTVVPRGQSHLPTTNRMMGNLAKLQNGILIKTGLLLKLLCADDLILMEKARKVYMIR